MAKGRFKLSSRSLSRLEGVDPRLREILKYAIYISPIDFGIPPDGGLRTAERQRELYLEKASKCDGYSLKSYHQTGKAVDVYAFVDGSASWDEDHLTAVAAAVLQASMKLGHRIEWGGLWDFKDMPHFQLID